MVTQIRRVEGISGLGLADALKTTTDSDTAYYFNTWSEVFENTNTLTTTREGEILTNIIKLGDDKKAKNRRNRREKSQKYTKRGKNVTLTGL